MNDLVNNIKASPGYAGGTISSNTDTDSAVVIDTQGFGSVAFALYSGAWTDGAYKLKIMETDNPDGSTGAAEVGSYQDQDTLGASNTVKKVGAKTTKRYCKLRISSTGVTSGCVFKGAVCLQGTPLNAPVA